MFHLGASLEGDPLGEPLGPPQVEGILWEDSFGGIPWGIPWGEYLGGSSGRIAGGPSWGLPLGAPVGPPLGLGNFSGGVPLWVPPVGSFCGIPPGDRGGDQVKGCVGGGGAHLVTVRWSVF